MNNENFKSLNSKEILAQLIVPAEDSSTPIKDNEAEYIYYLLKSKAIQRTLETGFAYAKSAAHIIAATEKKHIAIDPFQSNYKRLGIQNIQHLGLSDLLDFREDFSHNVLPELLRNNAKFDFIFIDGDHKFDGEFVDFYFADLLLEKQGYILLHDTWMRSTQLVMQFIKTNRTDYKAIPTGLRNLALYQKIGNDERNGMFFKEFYTFKSFLSHYLILWMSDGKKSFLKNLLFYLKEKLK